MLWLTGELHLEKPTVQHEVAWGQHFFSETIFDLAPDLLASFDVALKKHYPDETFEAPAFFQFGSWIGGDRDGNPFVTNAVTRETMRDNALASLNYYRHRIIDMARMLSISPRAAVIPQMLRDALEARYPTVKSAEAIRARNPMEPYRQFANIILAKLDQTIRAANDEEITDARYADADQLIDDLRLIEAALIEGASQSLATDLVRPLRRAVEIFRFSTVRLDLRENTTRTTATLREVWRLSTGGEKAPDETSAEWRAWLETMIAQHPAKSIARKQTHRRRLRRYRDVRSRRGSARSPRPRGFR